MFKKILIANRAEIATRVMATCSEMGIATVAIFGPSDTNAPFVEAADEAVALQDDGSYLDIEAIVDAALRTGATAVHPGYGFLSENADFASAVESAGLVFIGPRSDTIAAMGAKGEALATMSKAGVPVLESVVVSRSVDSAAVADEVGFPLLVKASRGGGGKGMRVIHEPAALEGAVESAQREALASFGDSTVLLERLVEHARHIEVQVMGDIHGNVVHIYDRECSVQRRFQKVIEEAPAPFLSDTTREALWDTAVKVARTVGYVGAGTVEFIVEPDDSFSFLEMNTRLQVEHTVTEETTGLDLVRMQIEIARGGHLPAQRDVPPVIGHAIEARIYAERPTHGYAPSTGAIDRFLVPPGVRVDAGVEDGSIVTHHFDPMIAKVVASAATRNEVIRVLVRALTSTEIHGVSTNRGLVVHALGDAAFVTGSIDTNWLDRLLGTLTEPDPGVMRVSATAAVLAIASGHREEASALATLPSGWRNVRSQPNQITLVTDDGAIEVTYVVGTGTPSVEVEGHAVDITAVYAVEPHRVDMAVDDIRMVFRVHRVDAEVYVDSVLGSEHFTVPPRLPLAQAAVAIGSMVPSTPGKVVAVLVAPGDIVISGDVLMVIESMKMEQATVATLSGRISSVAFAVGDQVAAHDVLVTIEESEDSDD